MSVVGAPVTVWQAPAGKEWETIKAVSLPRRLFPSVILMLLRMLGLGNLDGLQGEWEVYKYDQTKRIGLMQLPSA
jgi:hypothetical protein